MTKAEQLSFFNPDPPAGKLSKKEAKEIIENNRVEKLKTTVGKQSKELWEKIKQDNQDVGMSYSHGNQIMENLLDIGEEELNRLLDEYGATEGQKEFYQSIKFLSRKKPDIFLKLFVEPYGEGE